MRDFIDEHRGNLGVEPICGVLQVAPVGLSPLRGEQAQSGLAECRARRDAALVPQIERVWRASMQVYGADKVWRQLRREDTPVARCTVERLMRCHGLRGVVRGKVVCTTVSWTSSTGSAAHSGQISSRFRILRMSPLGGDGCTWPS